MSDFRKVALERLSSPEQVDEILRISNAREWIAFLAILILLTSVGVWAFAGSLPTKTGGQGVVVRTGGILNVSTLHGGLILSINAKVGDRIKRNQVIARVAQPTLLEQVRTQRMEIQQATRDRILANSVAMNGVALRLDALKLQRENALREIKEIEAQAQLAAEQIPVLDQLLVKGLVTKQQTVAGRQALVALQQQIAAHRAAIKLYDSQKYEVEAAPGQTDLERAGQVRRLQMVLDDLEQQLAISENVVSPYSGEVIEMKVDEGSIVQAEAPVLSLQPDVRNLEVLVCVPSRFAKDVAADMEAEVSPSQVRREEYGFIRGKVVYVAAYPATSTSLMRTFKNEGLVQSLMSVGPVTEITVRMIPDESTTSGFRWSSSKGPPLLISSGTLAAVDIITRRQRPISLLFPYVKRTVGAS